MLRFRAPNVLIVVIAVATLFTGAVNTSTVLRFRAVSDVARNLALRPADFAFDQTNSVLQMSLQLHNASTHRCRIEYLRLTVTVGNRFIGTVVAGHGPRLAEAVGPAHVLPGALTPLTTEIPLAGIHLDHYVSGVQAGRPLRAVGTLTISAPRLRAEIDRSVDVIF